MYDLKVATSAKSDIKRLPAKIKKATIAVLRELRIDPSIGKPLKRELTGKHTFSIGNYRIVYKIREKENVVEILKVRPRHVVYN